MRHRRRILLFMAASLLLTAVVGRWLYVERREVEAREERVYELTRQIYSPQDEKREETIRALRELGPAAVPELENLLQAKEQKWRVGIRKAASRLPAKARLKVYQRVPLRHAGTTRMLAARSLGVLGKDARPAIPALTKAMDDPTHSVCWSAAEALGHIGPEAIPPLVEATRSEKDMVRYSAIHGLGLMGSNALPAYPAMERLFADKVSYVQASAVTAARSLGPSGIPLLINSLTNDSARVRRVAKKALAIGVQAYDAVPVLQKLSDRKNPDELVETIKTIRAIWAFEPDTLQWHADLLDHPNAGVRLAVLQTFRSVGIHARPYLRAIERRKSDEDAAVRDLAGEVLNYLGSSPDPAH